MTRVRTKLWYQVRCIRKFGKFGKSRTTPTKRQTSRESELPSHKLSFSLLLPLSTNARVKGEISPRSWIFQTIKQENIKNCTSRFGRVVEGKSRIKHFSLLRAFSDESLKERTVRIFPVKTWKFSQFSSSTMALRLCWWFDGKLSATRRGFPSSVASLLEKFWCTRRAFKLFRQDIKENWLKFSKNICIRSVDWTSTLSRARQQRQAQSRVKKRRKKSARKV